MAGTGRLLHPLWTWPREQTPEVLRDYQEAYPSGMRSFNDDPEACLAYLRCPLAHHKAIRTTNLLERASQERCWRTKVLPHFFTEETCLKLVFSAFWHTTQRGRHVTMTELEQQLALLRRELGLPLYQDRRPTCTADEPTTPILQRDSDLTLSILTVKETRI